MLKKFFLISVFATLSLAEDYKVINCVLHIHSSFSGTKYNIEDIVNLAQQNGVDVIILTDHLVRKVEFGLWPVKNIVKRSYEHPSVLTSGVEKYLSAIYKFNQSHKDIIIIPGVEITPHYFWTVEENKLVAKNLHKHMLVLNLKDKQDFLSLPVIHNTTFLSVTRLLLLSLLVVISILSFVMRLKLLSVFCLLFIILSLPLKVPRFHQYKNYYDKPYQSLIDYINLRKRDLIILWAHPEAVNYERKVVVKKINNLEIAVETQPYYNSLLTTFNYDGFSIFAEGYRKIGCIGGLWDVILKEYLVGKRSKPVWCYSEVDFGETDDSLCCRVNKLYVKEKTYDEVIKSLKNGNFYTVWRDDDKELLLEQVRINLKKLVFGETYKIEGDKVNIEFALRFSDGSNWNTKIYIICNGEIAFYSEQTLPTKVIYTGNKPKSRSYYRIFIESKYPHMLATNPFFVE